MDEGVVSYVRCKSAHRLHTNAVAPQLTGDGARFFALFPSPWSGPSRIEMFVIGNYVLQRAPTLVLEWCVGFAVFA